MNIFRGGVFSGIHTETENLLQKAAKEKADPRRIESCTENLERLAKDLTEGGRKNIHYNDVETFRSCVSNMETCLNHVQSLVNKKKVEDKGVDLSRLRDIVDGLREEIPTLQKMAFEQKLERYNSVADLQKWIDQYAQEADKDPQELESTNLETWLQKYNEAITKEGARPSLPAIEKWFKINERCNFEAKPELENMNESLKEALKMALDHKAGSIGTEKPGLLGLYSMINSFLGTKLCPMEHQTGIIRSLTAAKLKEALPEMHNEFVGQVLGRSLVDVNKDVEQAKKKKQVKGPIEVPEEIETSQILNRMDKDFKKQIWSFSIKVNGKELPLTQVGSRFKDKTDTLDRLEKDHSLRAEDKKKQEDKCKLDLKRLVGDRVSYAKVLEKEYGVVFEGDQKKQLEAKEKKIQVYLARVLEGREVPEKEEGEEEAFDFGFGKVQEQEEPVNFSREILYEVLHATRKPEDMDKPLSETEKQMFLCLLPSMSQSSAIKALTDHFGAIQTDDGEEFAVRAEEKSTVDVSNKKGDLSVKHTSMLGVSSPSGSGTMLYESSTLYDIHKQAAASALEESFET